MIQHTRKFNISVLSEDVGFDVFKNFGYQCGRNVDKFANFYDVRRSPNEVLYITKNTNAFMSAFVQQEVDLGTHIMFIAQLVAAEVLSEKSTVTYDYYQKISNQSLNQLPLKAGDVGFVGMFMKVKTYLLILFAQFANMALWILRRYKFPTLTLPK